MIIEDFTHVQPEDKPVKQVKKVDSKIYDLDIVIQRARYFAELHNQLSQIEDFTRSKSPAYRVNQLEKMYIHGIYNHHSKTFT